MFNVSFVDAVFVDDGLEAGACRTVLSGPYGDLARVQQDVHSGRANYQQLLSVRKRFHELAFVAE